MAIFRQSDAAGSQRKLSPVVILVIVLAVFLCCCCATVAIVYVATGGKPVEKIRELFNANTYLPLYLSVRTWL